MDPVVDIFREEAREHLSALERTFLDLESAATSEARRPLIDGLFRHAHSMKSDAKVVGLPELKQAAQELEDILDDLRERPENVDRAAIDRGLAHFDKVRGAFNSWQSGASAESPPAPVAPAPEPRPAPPRAAVPADEATAPPPAQNAAPNASGAESFTVRVPSERLDRMLNLAGEIRISQSSGREIAGRLVELREHLAATIKAAGRRTAAETRRALDVAVDRVRRLESEFRKLRTREELLVEALETDVREARLLPLVMLTDSLRRAARDLSQTLGKPIAYEADVGKILLDKVVIEALKDPLMHLLRNAADHGLENQAERLAAGKPLEGRLRIEASQLGQLVQIAVSDDGRGVHYERIRRRLLELGQSDALVRALTPDELHACLFRPGFSTAPAGEISGRGVGLDVVRNSVSRIHGNVSLASTSAAGTTFVITVPVTVSTVRVLTLLSGGQYYGVPSSSVVRTGRATRKDLRELEGQLVLPVDGAPVRWVQLSDLLGTVSRPANGQAWSYLLFTQGQERIAIAADELEDETEVLLKPLGFPLGGMPGILGATIRAEGSVQLVLDLLQLANRGPRASSVRAAPAPKAAGRILVVDDSPTTRAVLRNLFTAAGYGVSVASDGVDALERLRTLTVDIVVSDVEMPRLNGLDLTRQIKIRFGLPVVLVTGKEREEHRREGLEAGADAYVVKSSFEDNSLLEIVAQFI